MKLAGRIQVEPLDDERLTKIERQIVVGAGEAAARGARGGRRWQLGFAAAALAVMVAGVIGWRLGAQTQAPALAVGVTTPVRIDTTSPRAMLDLGDATIASDPSTVFVVTRPGTGVLVELARGKVELEVDKRGDRAPLIVRAGDTDVIVIGTRFTVDYGDGTGEVEVRVTEGVVKVVRRTREMRVAAGHTWQTHRGLIAHADVVAPGPAATGPGVGSAAGELDVIAAAEDRKPGDDGYVVPVGDGPEVLRDRTAQVPTTRPSVTERTTPPTTPRSDGPELVRPPRTTTTPGPVFDLQALLRQQPVEPAADVGEPDAAKAIAKHRDIVNTSKGDEASRALYSIAVLQAMKLGRTGDAERTLEQFMRRFAHKQEHAAALWLRVRILCLREINARCRAAAYTYVHEAPSGPARNLAERITLTD